MAVAGTPIPRRSLPVKQQLAEKAQRQTAAARKPAPRGGQQAQAGGKRADAVPTPGKWGPWGPLAGPPQPPVASVDAKQPPPRPAM